MSLDRLPAARREGVAAALASLFDGRPVDDLRPIHGGASGAAVYRIKVGGAPYLLRLAPPRGPLHNVAQYACHRAAADAGFSPKIHLLDEEGGILVTDFISARPLSEYPGGPEALVGDLGRLIGRMQAETTFPPLIDYVDALARMIGFVAGSTLFAPGLLSPHLAAFESLREAWRAHPSPPVSSHNDPNLGNVLWDGERLWLIDWETAYRNDPLIDLAVVAENLCPTPALETVLLEAWGGPPSPLIEARLTVARALTRLYYAGIVLAGAAANPPARPIEDLTAMSSAELQAEVAAGRMTIGEPAMMLAFGRLLLARFLEATRAPGYDAALSAARSA